MWGIDFKDLKREDIFIKYKDDIKNFNYKYSNNNAEIHNYIYHPKSSLD
jgi:hypothetical protein